jgi:hypothetical protein
MIFRAEVKGYELSEVPSSFAVHRRFSLSGRATVRAIRLADACRILGKSAKPRAATAA